MAAGDRIDRRPSRIVIETAELRRGYTGTEGFTPSDEGRAATRRSSACSPAVSRRLRDRLDSHVAVVPLGSAAGAGGRFRGFLAVRMTRGFLGGFGIRQLTTRNPHVFAHVLGEVCGRGAA